MREIMISRHIIIQANQINKLIDLRRLHPLLYHKRSILQRQPRQITQRIIILAQDREIDVVQVDETRRAGVTAWDINNLENLQFL